MIDYDNLTKRQLMELLDAAETEKAALRAKIPEAPARVPEADALAACVTALDEMQRRSNYGGSASFSVGYAYGSHEPRQQGEVERVLRSLAARYNVPLVEERFQPCDLPHVDPNRISQLAGEIQATAVGLRR